MGRTQRTVRSRWYARDDLVFGNRRVDLAAADRSDVRADRGDVSSSWTLQRNDISVLEMLAVCSVGRIRDSVERVEQARRMCWLVCNVVGHRRRSGRRNRGEREERSEHRKTFPLALCLVSRSVIYLFILNHECEFESRISILARNLVDSTY